MTAIPDPAVLPWRTVQSYRLHYGYGSTFAAAWVIPVSSPTADEQVWKANCRGPGPVNMPEAHFPTAVAAKAAVEEHIAEQILNTYEEVAIHAKDGHTGLWQPREEEAR